ncbi:MAG: endonuclease/exonuclease/phosphatase family protein [Cyclobacteriaceae bacterium]
MEILKAILTGLIIFFSIGALLAYVNKPYWFIRIFDFPLLSNTIVLTVFTITYLLLFNIFDGWQVTLLAANFIAIIVAAFKLYRYLPWVQKAALPAQIDDPERQVSILNVNVRQSNRKTKALQEVIEELQPDLVVMHETNNCWHKEMAYLKESYPYHVLHPQENTYGMLLYSRLELLNPSVEFLCDEGVPSIHTFVKLPSGDRFKLYCIHPKPPEVGSHTKNRDTEIVLVGKMIGESDVPSVLTGDLNDVPWSKALILFRNLSNMVDPRRGRGFYNTYNAKFPIFRYPLDFINFTGHFRLLSLRRGKYIHSDHFPLYAQLSFEPDEAYDNMYKLIEEEKKDADEIISQKDRSVIPKPGMPHIDEW